MSCWWWVEKRERGGKNDEVDYHKRGLLKRKEGCRTVGNLETIQHMRLSKIRERLEIRQQQEGIARFCRRYSKTSEAGFRRESSWTGHRIAVCTTCTNGGWQGGSCTTHACAPIGSWCSVVGEKTVIGLATGHLIQALCTHSLQLKKRRKFNIIT